MTVRLEKFCKSSKAVIVGNDVFGLEVGDILYTEEEVRKIIQEAGTELGGRVDSVVMQGYGERK